MSSEEERQKAIDDFIKKNGVTRCPTAYVAPVTGAVPVSVQSHDKRGSLRDSIGTMFARHRGAHRRNGTKV